MNGSERQISIRSKRAGVDTDIWLAGMEIVPRTPNETEWYTLASTKVCDILSRYGTI